MPGLGLKNQEQKEKLQKDLKEHGHPEIKKRILILLWLNNGKTQP